MITSFIIRQIEKTERELGVKLDDIRHLAKWSWKGLMRYNKFINLAKFRGTVSPDLMMAAAIVGSLADDCSKCVEISLSYARSAGLTGDQLKAIVEKRFDQLPEKIAAVCQFADAVTKDTPEVEELRAELRRWMTEPQLIDLSMAIAFHRVYPTFKRALGFAPRCCGVDFSKALAHAHA